MKIKNIQRIEWFLMPRKSLKNRREDSEDKRSEDYVLLQKGYSQNNLPIKGGYRYNLCPDTTVPVISLSLAILYDSFHFLRKPFPPPPVDQSPQMPHNIF